MGKGNREIKNHVEQAVTFDRLVELLGLDEIVELQPSAEQLTEAAENRVAWIKSSDLVVPGVTTETMVLHHLLWFTSIGRVVVEDVDPLCGAVKIRIHQPQKKETGRML